MKTYDERMEELTKRYIPKSPEQRKRETSNYFITEEDEEDGRYEPEYERLTARDFLGSNL